MHNEAENAADTLAALAAAFTAQGWTYELIPIDDGSTDETRSVLARYAAIHPEVRPHGYRRNRGRGFALRCGFEEARGRFVVAMDADLSYSTATAVEMITLLMNDADTDIVLASQWMPGGNLENVPADRAFISWLGNQILRRTLPIKIHTTTSVCRAYRVEVLRSLDLASEGKEIHLEILSQAITLGYNIKEIPATLGSRKKGNSKFRPKATIISHLLFAVLERPVTIFAAMGMLVLLAGLPVAIYLLTVFFSGQLNPERPLMTVMVVLFLGGFAGLSFALQSLQLLELRRSLIRLRSDMTHMRREKGGEEPPVREGTRMRAAAPVGARQKVRAGGLRPTSYVALSEPASARALAAPASSAGVGRFSADVALEDTDLYDLEFHALGRTLFDRRVPSDAALAESAR
jgi:glycosyltransferase involved in cell wall biosynthesis